jgi:hypothetical protein
MAAQINVTYSRMLFWLDRKVENGNYPACGARRCWPAKQPKNAGSSFDPTKPRIDTVRLYAAILGTAAAVMGIGLSRLARRRR